MSYSWKLLAVIVIWSCSDHVVAQLNQDFLLPTKQPIVAVGTRGTIASSGDGGFNWVPQKLQGGLTVDLFGVFVMDDASAVAVGGNCNGVYGGSTCGIFRRQEGTQTQQDLEWTKSAVSIDGATAENLRQLTSVTFCNASLGFVVGQNGALLRSADGGRNWGVVQSGTNLNLASIQCLPGGVLLIAGSSGLILRSSDGIVWRRPTELFSSATGAADQDLTGLLFNSSSRGIVTGTGIWSTDNGGQTWRGYVGSGIRPSITTGHAARGLMPLYSIAMIGNAGSKLLLWDAAPDTFNASATTTFGRWSTEALPPGMSAKAVLLPGQGTECPRCQSVIVAGNALSSVSNSDCSISSASCSSTCCGPVLLRAGQGNELRTALWPQQQVPVACRSMTDCSIINFIAATTGSTPPLIVPATSPPPNATTQLNTTLSIPVEFLVDTNGVIAFKLDLYIDSLRPLLDFPQDYLPVAKDEASSDLPNMRIVTLSLSSTSSFNASAAVVRILQLARASQGITSKLCQTGTRRVRVSAGVLARADQVVMDCADHSIPWAVSTAVIVICVSYVCSGIILAFLFSLPKYRVLQKNLFAAYLLWFFFGFLGSHRFYLRLPKSGILWLCTLGLFGFGWIADALLTYSNYKNTCFDRDLEASDVPLRRVRNAPRPQFVSRREALKTLSERQQIEGEGGGRAARVTTIQLISELQLEPGGFGENHISPIMYPKLHKLVSEKVPVGLADTAGPKQEVEYDGSVSVVV